MGDTTNVGEIAVQISADTQKLQRGMKEASNEVANFSTRSTSSLDQFGNSVRSTMSKFEISNRDLKKGVNAVGEALGISGHDVGEYAQNFAELGPVVGGALTAIQAFNVIQKEEARLAKEAVVAHREYMASFRQLAEMQGRVRGSGMFNAEQAKFIDSIDDKVSALRDKMTELGATSEFNADQKAALQSRIDGLNAQKQAAQELQNQLEPANRAREEFDQAMNANRRFLKPGSDIAAKAELRDTIELANKYKDILASLPEGSSGQLRVMKELQAAQERINALANQQKDAEKERAAKMDKMLNAAAKRDEQQSIKEMEPIENEIEKKIKALQSVATGAFERSASPLEKLKKDIASLDEAKMRGVFEQFANPDEAFMKARGQLFKEFQAQSLASSVSVGFGMQLDTSNVSVEALKASDAKVQKVESPDFKIMNEKLDQLIQVEKDKKGDTVGVAA